jgi:cytochrome b pre-mRNA-processing protein 3
MLFLRRFLRDEQLESAAAVLYGRFAGQARLPAFYLSLGVPDTVDGRFEMVALHAFLVFRRLKGQGEGIDRLAQATYDVMFKEMDLALREMGAADLGVGRRIMHMTEALNGRIQAYEKGLAAADDSVLQDALRRNLFGTVTPEATVLAAMTSYLRGNAAALESQDVAKIAAGEIAFQPPKPPEGR